MKKLNWLASISSCALLTLAALSSAASAQTPEEKGLKIAQDADASDTGWGDSKSEMVMTLRNKNGDESVRELRVQTLEQPQEGDKSLIVFDTPKDVQGTALLTYTHKEGDDDQWLYLPALKRVKRIASSNQSGPFMGSEFAYEDLSSQEVEKYTYKFLQDEELNGVMCYVIERIPTHPKSGYTRQVAWIDQDEYRIHKTDFYDRKGALLKTLTMHDYKEYLDDFWRPDRMEMVNHQTGKSTTLEWKGYEFNNGFTPRDFDQNSLKSTR